VPDTSRFGRVRIDGGGRLLAFDEKRTHAGPGLINAGVYLIKRPLLMSIPTGRTLSVECDIFPSWIGRAFYGHPVRARFLDIGTPQSFAEAEAFFNSPPLHDPLRGYPGEGRGEGASSQVPIERLAAPPRALTPCPSPGGRGEQEPRRFVLLDRDGTINVECGYISSSNQVQLLPRAAEALRALRAMGLGLIVVTNQSAIGRGYIDMSRLDEIHRRFRQLLADSGVELDGIYVCPHTAADGCACRKPLPGLVQQAAAEHGFRPADCFVIGDKPSDINLGKAVGATTILVRTGYGAEHEAARATSPDHVANDLFAAAEWIGQSIGRA
jgi:D-glycero-D-manno-heptose 1,7-bisphosphate phosphatase